MEIEKIIHETKIVPREKVLNLLTNYEHPNGLSPETIRKILFSYKEGLDNSPQTKQTLQSAITYAEHALQKIPEEPDRNKGILRGQILFYLALFYERVQHNKQDCTITAYEKTTQSIQDAIEYRDWGSIAERTNARKRQIDKIKSIDSPTWYLRGANDANNTAVDLNKKTFPYKNVTSGIFALASRLYQDASHEFKDEETKRTLLKISHECMQNSVAMADPKQKDEKLKELAEISQTMYFFTKEKKYRRDALKIYEELRHSQKNHIRIEATRKVKMINRQS